MTENQKTAKLIVDEVLLPHRPNRSFSSAFCGTIHVAISAVPSNDCRPAVPLDTLAWGRRLFGRPFRQAAFCNARMARP